MCKVRVIIGFLLLHGIITAENGINKLFPKSAFTLQYAGSTGFMTIGFSKVATKLELGILYGNIPHSLGGVNYSVSLKVAYTPFRFGKKIRMEPVQIGTFPCQNFGKNLGLRWEKQYPKGYYWWTRSLRFHCFISSQISYAIAKKQADRIAFFFEANTNDLYIFSYITNRKSIKLYDIVFFGTGIKLYYSF